MKIKEFLNLLKSNLDNIIILDGKGFKVFDKKRKFTLSIMMNIKI